MPDSFMSGGIASFNEHKAYLILSLNAAVSNRIVFTAIQKAGSASELVHIAMSGRGKFEGIARNKFDRFSKMIRSVNIEERIDELAAKNITLITPADEEYPSVLLNIYDPPLSLYRVGRPLRKDIEYLAVVGTRKSTHYGERAAESIVAKLTDKIGIVSGMASGIDSRAHKTALDAGAYTVAVLGTGADYIYPRSNKLLYERICKEGTVLSEYAPGAGPEKYTFPRRNRIISGLSRGVLVIECGKRSGSLITASFGLEQGKDIFAVPGSILSGTSSGTNGLIRDGAVPVFSAEDITGYWGVETKTRKPVNVTPIHLTEGEKKVISLLSVDEPVTMEEVLSTSREEFDAAELSAVFTGLFIKGLIRELPGKRFVLMQEVY